MTTEPKKPKWPRRLRYAFDVYAARDGYRWRLWAHNGHIVADSGEAYTKRGNAVRACEKLQNSAMSSTIFVHGVELQDV